MPKEVRRGSKVYEKNLYTCSLCNLFYLLSWLLRRHMPRLSQQKVARSPMYEML